MRVGKKGTIEPPEYFCIRFGAPSFTSLPQIQWLMTKGSWVVETWVFSGAGFFIKQLHALKVLFENKYYLCKLSESILFLILTHYGKNHIPFTLANFGISQFVSGVLQG